MEHTPQVKRGEEYPLLRVEAGGGDGKARNTISPITPTTGWNVTCSPKRAWYSRWPEFVSAFWMTLILLAISFLVFYALGMSAYRRQPIVIVNCNNTKQGSDVFYHHIIPRDTNVPFTIFSDYLSFMARQYPFLRFSVFFLIDDSSKSPFRSKDSNPQLLRRLVPHISGTLNTAFNQNYKREIRDFQKQYQNVNISVMYLSKYMMSTPLRFRWKMIPQNYLSFYARIYEIWQNGGIGFDLMTFNNQFNINKDMDSRVDSILKHHNNGLETERYADMLNTLEEEEQKELFSMFFHLIDQILNEARSFFDPNFSNNITVLDKNPKIRTHRSKRDVGTNITLSYMNSNITASNNDTDELVEIIKIDPIKSNIVNEVSNKNVSSLNNTFNTLKEKDVELSNGVNENEIPKVILFFDISEFYDDTGLTNLLPKSIAQPDAAPITRFGTRYPVTRDQRRFNYLSLSPEGFFVAASSPHHPFLAKIFSSGCHSLNPKYAIKETLVSQCSRFLRNDIYCENIRVLYNVV